jgi:site-specific DNA-adenine methylase
MKKNHFFIPYFGNKRTEVEALYNEVKDKLDDIETIIEPFCGTSAFSYYLSLKHPGKFKYILNDNNEHLIKLYETAKQPEELENLITTLKDFSTDLTKEKYNNIVKDDKFENWIYKNKHYNIRPGLYPSGDRPISNHFFDDMKKTPIINFLRNEDITFINGDGIDLINQYKDDDKSLIFLDPPYMMATNDYYIDSKINVYEYLFNNKISEMNALVLLCLEDIWIIKMLFNNFIKFTYNKKYGCNQKKKTTHVIISNR